MSAGVSNHANDEAAAAVAPAFVRPSAALLDSLRTHAAPASPALLGAPAAPLRASLSLSASSSAARSKEFQIAIPRHQIRNGRTVYELRCTEVMDGAGLVGLTDVVFHRFDDFAQLHDKVRNSI